MKISKIIGFILLLVLMCVFGSPMAEVALVIAFVMVTRVVFSNAIKDVIILCVLFLISDGVRNLGGDRSGVGALNELSASWQPISKVVTIDKMTSNISFGAFQLTLPLLTGCALLFFFIYTFKGKNWFDFLLLAVLIICAISSYYGYLRGHNGFSTGLSISFSMLAFYWGKHLRGMPSDIENWLVTFFNCSYAGIILCAIGIIQGHLIFLLVGLSGPTAFYYMGFGRYWRWAIIFACSLLIVANTTFTLLLMFVMSFSLSYLVYKKRRLSAMSGVLLYVFFLVASFCLLYFAINSNGLHYSGDSTYLETAFDKFAYDRAPVWRGAFELITERTGVISPASRSYDVSFSGIETQWIVGAHNVFLEIFRQIGWLGGIMISSLILYMLYYLFQISSSQAYIELKLLSISLISVFFTYGLTGHYLLTGGVGILYGALCGLVYTAVRRWSDIVRSPAGGHARSLYKQEI